MMDDDEDEVEEYAEAARMGELLTPFRILENVARLAVDIFDSLSACACQVAEDLSASQALAAKSREEKKARRLLADDLRSLEEGNHD